MKQQSDLRHIDALPRGIVDCNPGNLRPGVGWQGLVGGENGYCRFENDLAGIRAAAINLWTARYRHHHLTLPEIITAWAPPNENRTWAYVKFVADAVLPRDQPVSRTPINVENPRVAIAMLQAMFVFENGHPPLTWRSWPEWYCYRTMCAALKDGGHWPGIEVPK